MCCICVVVAAHHLPGDSGGCAWHGGWHAAPPAQPARLQQGQRLVRAVYVCVRACVRVCVYVCVCVKFAKSMAHTSNLGSLQEGSSVPLSNHTCVLAVFSHLKVVSFLLLGLAYV